MPHDTGKLDTTMTNINLSAQETPDEAAKVLRNSGLEPQACSNTVKPDPALLAAATAAASDYAGDVSPQMAYQWWVSGEAVLIDVRTDAEREWVGFVPGAVALAWKQWPGMAMNLRFDEGVKSAVVTGQKVVFLCRSGVRSIAAAKRATELGFKAYNILEGFEGNPDELGHRGKKQGWRFLGLPWRQL